MMLIVSILWCLAPRLDHGADGTMQDADGETALHKAAAEVSCVLAKETPCHWVQGALEVNRCCADFSV